MRRKDREMPAEFARQVFDACEYATISMIDARNQPYALPVSIVRIGDNLYFHSALSGTKTDCLRLHPQVCVSAVSWTHLVPDQFTTEFSSAVCHGTASEVTDDTEKIAALRAICEKFAPTHMAAFDHAIARSLSRTAIWKISMDSITGKRKKYDSHGKELTFGRTE
ncbi:MAG: pyridoxamine 5'-phosphate oxidase family protein [Eubacteriales bacterium]|nr:pyridoxamine 5'-phosphate oxidase family protein [Eubacteriales bacterium]